MFIKFNSVKQIYRGRFSTTKKYHVLDFYEANNVAIIEDDIGNEFWVQTKNCTIGDVELILE